MPNASLSINSFYKIIWKDFFNRETFYLKKLVKKYEGKPIKFIGISMDLDYKINNRGKDRWKETIKREKLNEISIQLIADKGYRSDFINFFTYNTFHSSLHRLKVLYKEDLGWF